MAVSLRGNLTDFGIADVFQLIGQQRKTGMLEFTREREQIQILFERGAVVSAAPCGSWPQAATAEMLMRCGLLTRERVEELRSECSASAQTLNRVILSRNWLSAEELRNIEELLTRETIFAVLRWKAGSFDFTAGEVEHDRSAESLLGAEQILMDGLRMVDEWQSFADLVPSDDTVFRRLLSFDQYTARCRGEAAAQLANAKRVFELVDGRLPVRRVIDLSLLGSFDAVRALAQLHRANIIETVELESVAATEEPDLATARRAPRFAALASIACVALLAVVALSIRLQGESLRAQPDPFAIERPSALELVRGVQHKRRVRHVLETYWFRHGEWPASLAQVAADGFLSQRELAGEQGRPYYYAVRDDGAWLLAPDR